MTLPPSVSLVDETAGYPILVIDHPMATGRIALNGAHVMEWTPAGEAPVLYMSPLAELEPGKAIRGGIPVCWPWFGGHPTEPDQPAHGFVRNRMWQVGTVTEDPAGITLQFHLSDDELSRSVWPHRFALCLEVKMGAQFSIALQIQNTDETPWSMTGALHTYLCVQDVTTATVLGLDQVPFVESRLSPERIQQSGPVVFDREVDRNYASADTLTLCDPSGGRSLIVSKTGSQSSVVWNPWIEKSKRLPDLPDDAYPHFVCIEAANAGPDIITLAPGQEHFLSQHLQVLRDLA
ncbi:MAG: D-hexose-6-phosphate mutarotase [Verrucomicrobiaceae bacterium]|nr:D-hexose-6-phosphate mutarotase [Verrucomicrobiaceae bacterium]